MSIFKMPGLPGAQVPSAQVAAPAADLLTKEQVELAVPAHLKSSVTQSLVDTINTIVTDDILAEQYRNNFVSYTSVMKEGKFKMEDYLHAVLYVSYKLMGYNNQDAYMRTFPARHQSLVAKGTSSKDIAAYVSAYARGKLVNLIMDQCMVPVHVLNQDIFQKAINHQFFLMTNATSEKVQSDAANSLLTHLKKPEGKGVEVNIDMRETSGISELNAALEKMALRQIEHLQAGGDMKDVTGSVIYEAEATGDENQ